MAHWTIKTVSFLLLPSSLLLLILIIPLPSYSQTRFTVDPNKSLVQFKSDAMLNSFVGKTKDVSGTLEFDPKNINNTRGTFTVNLASIDTGNRLRNKHMREKFLNTNQYPEMTFALEKVITEINELPPNQDVTISVDGRISLRGITRKQTVTLNVLHDTNKNEMRITGIFPITLSDYKIKTPSFMDMFVENTLPITINLLLK